MRALSSSSLRTSSIVGTIGETPIGRPDFKASSHFQMLFKTYKSLSLDCSLSSENSWVDLVIKQAPRRSFLLQFPLSIHWPPFFPLQDQKSGIRRFRSERIAEKCHHLVYRLGSGCSDSGTSLHKAWLIFTSSSVFADPQSVRNPHDIRSRVARHILQFNTIEQSPFQL